MTIKYTFTNQFNPIRGVVFLEKKKFTIKELRLYLTNKHKLNMSEYSIFQKKKKLNDDYIFLEIRMLLFMKNVNSVLMKEENYYWKLERCYDIAFGD